jgi:hypothetical protein
MEWLYLGKIWPTDQSSDKRSGEEKSFDVYSLRSFSI